MGMRRARVRIVRDISTRSVDPGDAINWHAGEELVMFQWDRNPGLPPADHAWWTDFDIDGAHIIAAEHIQVLEVLEERSD